MRGRSTFAVLSLILFLFATPRSSTAQTTTTVVASSSCLADWWCQRFRPPLGLYVQGVELGGRYVTLEDGSVWEVELSDRATAAGWVADDFVGLRLIAAPRGDYEYLLTKTGVIDQKVAARLAGRRASAYRTAQPAPEE